MCRLFGFRSAVPSRAHRSLVAAENAMSLQAREHRDGWGLAWFHAGDAYVVKSETGAADCASFRRASERLTSHTMVVHVRRATVGEPSPFNVHPFRHGRWVFAHNGTIFGFERIRARLLAEMPDTLSAHILGTTDTETLFFWLLARL
jgi:glutamine amidotransferase